MTDATLELVRRGASALQRSALWWGMGTVALAFVSVAFWPSLEGSSALTDLQDSSQTLLEAFGAQNLTTAAGYLDGQLYALLLPLLLAGFAIAAVTSITSGDEDAGRLELVHALPVGRVMVWLSRFGSSVLALAGVTIATAIVVAASLGPFSLDEVSVGRIVAVTLACGALGMFHAAVAYAVGGAGGSRSLSVGLSIAVLVIGYVANFLLPLSDSLEGARKLSPWYWAIGSQPVTDGISAAWMFLLLAVTAVLVAVGTVAVTRRDIRSA